MNQTATLQITAPNECGIAMTRVFNAPRRLVFEALTTPELVQRWLLGPPGWTMPVCEIDLRAGGCYRYVWRDAGGKTMGVRGVYREIAPPERLVQTEKFDDPWYPGEALVTTVLVEHGGQTTLTATMLYQSRQIRDGIVKSGMERGVSASYDRLAQVVASLDPQGTGQPAS